MILGASGRAAAMRSMMINVFVGLIIGFCAGVAFAFAMVAFGFSGSDADIVRTARGMSVVMSIMMLGLSGLLLLSAFKPKH